MTAAKGSLEALAIALRADLAHADKHANALSRWTATAPVGIETYAAATLLHHLYGAVEAITERSLKTFDGKLPTGAATHTRLLEQASTAVEGVREAILPRDEAIKELRRFRHRFRKRYDDELEPALLHSLIKDVLEAWPRIRAHLVGFAAFVDECARVAP